MQLQIQISLDPTQNNNNILLLLKIWNNNPEDVSDVITFSWAACEHIVWHWLGRKLLMKDAVKMHYGKCMILVIFCKSQDLMEQYDCVPRYQWKNR